MADLIGPDAEQIVGAKRHPLFHIARAVSAEEKVYVLHSAACMAATPDLTTCKFSIALDEGIDIEVWTGYENRPMPVVISKETKMLVPVILGRPD